jgi:uncharacterized membrane protein
MLLDRDPRHWKFLVFYYNPDEPRLFVAKRSGAPITLNYARPAAWVISAVPIAILAALAVVNNILSAGPRP